MDPLPPELLANVKTRLGITVYDTRVTAGPGEVYNDIAELRKNNGRRYEPMEVERDKIMDLYLVKGIIKKHSREHC